MGISDFKVCKRRYKCRSLYFGSDQVKKNAFYQFRILPVPKIMKGSVRVPCESDWKGQGLTSKEWPVQQEIGRCWVRVCKRITINLAGRFTSWGRGLGERRSGTNVRAGDKQAFGLLEPTRRRFVRPIQVCRHRPMIRIFDCNPVFWFQIALRNETHSPPSKRT